MTYEQFDHLFSGILWDIRVKNLLIFLVHCIHRMLKKRIFTILQPDFLISYKWSQPGTCLNATVSILFYYLRIDLIFTKLFHQI